MKRIYLTVAGVVLMATSLLGNPTDKDPSRPLAVHGTIESGSVDVANLYAIYDEAQAMVIDMRANQNQLQKFSGKKLQDLYSRLWKGERDAKRLEWMGEPAGIDLSVRLTRMRTEQGVLNVRFASTPQGLKLNQQSLVKLKRSRAKLDKFMGQARAALESGKLDAFEKQMDIRGVEIARDIGLMTRTVYKKEVLGFFELVSMGDTQIEVLRRKQYAAVARAKVLEQLSGAVGFEEEAKRVIQEMATSGSVTIGEGEQAGPVQAFDHLADRWAFASAGVVRAHAIRGALLVDEKDEAIKEIGQLKSMAVQSLVALLDAIANSIEPSQVSSVYPQLLERLSVLQRRSGITLYTVAQDFQPVLEKLSQKQPEFAQQCIRYQRSTKEALRWRQLFASQRAALLQESTPALAGLMASKPNAVIAQSPNEPDARFRPQESAPLVMSGQADWTIQHAARALIGKTVYDKPVVRLSAKSKVGIVPFETSHYVNMAMPAASVSQHDDLATALLVSPDHPPLSMQAGDAISSSQMQDYESVGGVIKAMHLEGQVNRFVQLPDAAYVLSPLRRVPAYHKDAQPLRCWCWRFDLQPTWVQHQYYTVGGKF